MKLSVVIVNYNVKYYVDQCLQSVVGAIGELGRHGGSRDNSMDWPAEVVVVDNHSADGSVEYLSQRYPKDKYPYIRFVASGHNLGFARANNIAIRQTEGDYVLLLNPDTFVGEDVLVDSLRFMDAHADAGALGVRMLNGKGGAAMESRRGLPTPLVAFYKMMGFCNRWPCHPVFGRYYLGFLPWDKACRIEVVSGAFCMLRREVLHQVGLLDETFFMYGEDIDLSYRILKQGYHNYYLPVDIMHYKGESTEKSSFRYVHVFYEAMLIFFRKHYSNMSFLLSVPIKAAIYVKASVALVKMLSERVHKSLGFFTPRRETTLRYLFVGEESMLESCRQIALAKGLEASFLLLTDFLAHSLSALGETALRGCNVIVLDVDALGYGEALRLMATIHKHGLDVELGTYSSHIGKVITAGDIF